MTREERIAERQAAARSREKRYRTLNMLLRLPATRDLDRAIKVGVTDWIHARGIVDPVDIVRTDGTIVAAFLKRLASVGSRAAARRMWAHYLLSLEPDAL